MRVNNNNNNIIIIIVKLIIKNNGENNHGAPCDNATKCEGIVQLLLGWLVSENALVLLK